MDYSNEIADGGTTYYGSLTAFDGSAHDSALFVPNQYHQDPTLNLILYFHGHQTTYPDLRSYIHRANTRPLRTAVAADGRFALAIPWLRTGSDASHIVRSTAAFELYMNAVVGQLMAQTSATASAYASPGIRLILAAHSGGGRALSAAITLSSSYIGKVISVWAFDCFYEDKSADWIAWANANPRKTMYIYYTDLGDPGRGTMRNSQRIDVATGTNVTAGLARVGHDEIPKTYFPDLLSTIP